MSESVWSAYLLALLLFVALIAHEIVFVTFGIVEPVFLFLGYLCMGLLWLWLIYVVGSFFVNQEPVDLWKLSLLATFGLLGSVVQLESILICFFPLIGLWGVRSDHHSHHHHLTYLLLGSLGLLALLVRYNFSLSFEPSTWGDNLLLGSTALVALTLVINLRTYN